MKGKLLPIVCAIVIICSLAAGTVAFYTKDATAINAITTGKVNLEIVEMTKENTEFPKSGVVVLPGATISKIVSVKNTANHPIYVRVQLSKSVDDKKLQKDFMSNNILSTDFNSKDWTVGKDGFIYYNKVLEAGKKTAPLINEVYISGPKTDNKYRGKTFTLQVDAYGVQSQNNGNDYSEAAGWSKAKPVNASAVFIPVVD